MSKVAARRGASPRPKIRRRIWPYLGAAALIALLVTVMSRDAVERVFLERAFAGTVAGNATIGALRHEGGRRILGDVKLRSADGAVNLEADRVELRDRAGTLEIAATGVRVGIAIERLHGDEAARFAGLDAPLGAQRFILTLKNATAKAGRAAADGALQVAAISGSVRRTGAGGGYDLKLVVASAGGAYPLDGHGSTDADGRFVHRWSADALPVAPFGALLPPGDLTLREGLARNVVLRAGAGARLSMELNGVAGTLGAHELHALTGPLVVSADGIGTPGISGTVDGGIPVDVAGEVHDAGGWAPALGAGTNDLRALGRLFNTVASQANLKWMKLETTAPGIAFGQYAMTTKDIPHVVQLLTVDPREPTLHFGTALAEDHVISKGERTSELGVRTNAVAGVNGDYFDIGRTYEPQGMLVRDGALVHGPTDHYALTFDRANNVRFAIFHLNGKVVAGDRSYRITQFNSWPGRYVSVITPEYGKTLPAAAGMRFAALERVEGTRYRVLSVEHADAPIPARLGLGFGSTVKGRLPAPGEIVDVTYALDPPLDGVVTGISSGPLLLKNGAWYEDKRAPAPDERDVPWPVVALGTMADGTLMFAAVDGRHPERSIGMPRTEFAELLRGFGVVDAMALDSGGSVTMVSRAPGDTAVSVRNVPSDNSAERYVSDALFVYSTAPAGTIVTTPRPAASAKPAT